MPPSIAAYRRTTAAIAPPFLAVSPLMTVRAFTNSGFFPPVGM
jgi:hypothetical protein